MINRAVLTGCLWFQRVTVAGLGLDGEAADEPESDTIRAAPLPSPELAQRLWSAVGVSDLGQVDADRRYYGNFTGARRRHPASANL